MGRPLMKNVGALTAPGRFDTYDFSPNIFHYGMDLKNIETKTLYHPRKAFVVRGPYDDASIRMEIPKINRMLREILRDHSRSSAILFSAPEHGLNTYRI